MEIFECQNCNKRDVLNSHGKCQRCGSQAVVSLHQITSHETLQIMVDIFTHDELKVMFGLCCEEVGEA